MFLQQDENCIRVVGDSMVRDTKMSPSYAQWRIADLQRFPAEYFVSMARHGSHWRSRLGKIHDVCLIAGRGVDHKAGGCFRSRIDGKRPSHQTSVKEGEKSWCAKCGTAAMGRQLTQNQYLHQGHSSWQLLKTCLVWGLGQWKMSKKWYSKPTNTTVYLVPLSSCE